jgi:starch-binding outer membrane protein, SusD/RagB family
MKNLKIILYIAIFALFTSCGSLDEPSYGKTTTENFYEKESDINYALTGTYLQLRKTWEEYARDHFALGDATTDDAWKGGGSEGDWGEYLELEIFVINSTNNASQRYWQIAYNIINNANNVIYYGPKALGDETILARYVKEAKALRGFAYYCLVTKFGGVPLLTEPKLPAEVLTMSRAAAEEIYAQVIKDFEDASTLPSRKEYASADAYRMTRGFAKTMLAKTYLFRNDFAKAELVLKEIVETDNDYALLDDYGKNWRKEYENSTESVWEIPNKMYDKNVATGTNVPHFFTSRAGVPGYGGYGFHCPTQNLWDAYDPDDPRLTYIFTNTGDKYTGDTKAQSNSIAPDRFHDYKMTVPSADKIGFNVWLIPYNIRLIRYADVLLMYAEALNENGKSADALNYLNQIRARARNTNPRDPRRDVQIYIPPTTTNTLPNITVMDKTQLRNLIWKERRLELAMEGWRRDDLLRQKRFGEVMRAFSAKYNSNKGKYFDDAKHYLLPIPQNDIDRTNGALIQNPGY